MTACGCGVILPPHDGPTHAYLGASAARWAVFGAVLARDYGSPERMTVHRLTVDAYAAQHPGVPEWPTIQSDWVHLAALHFVVDHGVGHDFARRVLGALAAESATLPRLPPPRDLGPVTVADIARATDSAAHIIAVRRWAAAV